MGAIAGPLLGGALTQYTTWRWCKFLLLHHWFFSISFGSTGFYINLPIGGFAAAVLACTRVPEQTQKPSAISVFRTLHKKLDLVGFALFAPAIIQLLLALQYGGNEYAWNSATVIGLFCGAAGTSIVFLLWDYHKGDEAMIPFSIVCQRVVWSSCGVYFVLMSQVFIAAYYLPIYFQGVKGVSPTMSGVYLLPSILGQLFLAVGTGVLG